MNSTYFKISFIIIAIYIVSCVPIPNGGTPTVNFILNPPSIKYDSIITVFYSYNDSEFPYNTIVDSSFFKIKFEYYTDGYIKKTTFKNINNSINSYIPNFNGSISYEYKDSVLTCNIEYDGHSYKYITTNIFNSNGKLKSMEIYNKGSLPSNSFKTNHTFEDFYDYLKVINMNDSFNIYKTNIKDGFFNSNFNYNKYYIVNNAQFGFYEYRLEYLYGPLDNISIPLQFAGIPVLHNPNVKLIDSIYAPSNIGETFYSYYNYKYTLNTNGLIKYYDTYSYYSGHQVYKITERTYFFYK